MYKIQGEAKQFVFAFFIMNDQFYMRRCIELAQKALGQTYPNPLVGAVIVHDDKIIGEGYHHKAGEAHAEINAINSVRNKELIPYSTIYVSLEPCAHFGKTPPCALKIKELGFKRVVIGSMDSNEKVNGKGKKIIEEAGIKVISGILEKECREVNKRFFTFYDKRRPYVILKWAQSADHFLDKEFQPAQISNAFTSQMVHQLRADEHAILVGTNTALNDNPSLTVRKVAGINPIRILIDLDLKVSADFNIFNTEAPTIILNCVKNETREHLKFIKVDRQNLPQQIIERLYESNIQSIIIEGGSYTLQQFIDRGIWDEAMVITNNKLFFKSGTPAPRLNLEPENISIFNECAVSRFRNN